MSVIKRPQTLFAADQVSFFLDHMGKVVIRTTSEQESARYFELSPDVLDGIENWFQEVRTFWGERSAEKEWTAPSAAWAEGWASAFRGHDCPSPFREGTDERYQWTLGHEFGIAERNRLRDRYVEVKT